MCYLALHKTSPFRGRWICEAKTERVFLHFRVEKIRQFSTLSTRFSTRFAENLQNKRGKAVFFLKNRVENPGKTVEYHILWGKVVEIPRPPQRMRPRIPKKGEYL